MTKDLTYLWWSQVIEIFWRRFKEKHTVVYQKTLALLLGSDWFEIFHLWRLEAQIPTQCNCDTSTEEVFFNGFLLFWFLNFHYLLFFFIEYRNRTDKTGRITGKKGVRKVVGTGSPGSHKEIGFSSLRHPWWIWRWYFTGRLPSTRQTTTWRSGKLSIPESLFFYAGVGTAEKIN